MAEFLPEKILSNVFVGFVSCWNASFSLIISLLVYQTMSIRKKSVNIRDKMCLTVNNKDIME